MALGTVLGFYQFAFSVYSYTAIGGSCYYRPHFTDEENEAKNGWRGCKGSRLKGYSTSQLVRGRMQIPALRPSNSKPRSQSPCYGKLFGGLPMILMISQLWEKPRRGPCHSQRVHLSEMYNPSPSSVSGRKIVCEQLSL